MSFFPTLTVDLVEGLLDLLLAPITVYVHSQHQSLRMRGGNVTNTAKQEHMAGGLEGNTYCKHKQKLPPPDGGKWQPKQEEWNGG